MAGSELTGYANSSADIMKNARYVITPTSKTTDSQIERFKSLILDMKANPIVMDYTVHDKSVAAISHLPHLISLIVSDEFMQNLTDEQQQIIRQAAETAKQYAREQSDERIASKVKTIEDSGTQIITLSDEVRNEIREKCSPIYESIEDSVSADIVEAYLGDLADDIN